MLTSCGLDQSVDLFGGRRRLTRRTRGRFSLPTRCCTQRLDRDEKFFSGGTVCISSIERVDQKLIEGT